MKSRLLLLSASALITALLALSFRESLVLTNELQPAEPAAKKPVIRCSPDWEQLENWLNESDIPPIPGAGLYKWKIRTTSDSAQFYFNQGINMYYSFHIIEAMASFKKASRFDPESAMLYWAQALTYGPNINDIGYAASPEALLAINTAMEKMSSVSEKEKILILAQRVRYSEDSTKSRTTLNRLYADKMKEAYERFPSDADIAALYADALMLQHPWDLWKIDGTPKAWTPHIRNVLEKLLARSPNHPGANHYYIHVMEASPFPSKALASADRLGKLTPGLSHTVHMPSHIYLRSGQYEKGVTVNEDAVISYRKSIPLFQPVTGNEFLYLIHNLHMQSNNALMTGKSAYSIKVARETANSVPSDYLVIPGAMGNYMQNIYMTPQIIDVRFGNWSQLLGYPEPARELIYARVIHHFCRGMALAATKRLAEAKYELNELRILTKDSVLYAPFEPFSPAIDAATVAEHLLDGSIAFHEQRIDDAINSFTKACEREEKMVYNEPRDWMLSPRQYLGNALLKAGKKHEAAQIFQKDLMSNNENGWALYGLWQAYTMQKKTSEAAKIMIRFKKAFGKADIQLNAAVF